MSPRAGGRRRRLTLLAVGLTALAMLAGCTYAAEEPGLFERPSPSSIAPRPSRSSPSPPATNPELPVLGEAVWTSADGLDVQVRVAVHALRRIEGATVLDWSVTPLAVPNLRVDDPVPANVDLGLSRAGEVRPRILLVDAAGARAYPPLAGAAGSTGCVCTPLSTAQRRLRIGHTTVLQVAFPALPAGMSTIDVSFASIPPFWRVPIAPVAHVPVARAPADLARPVRQIPPTAGFTDMFRYGPAEQVFRIEVRRLVAGSTFTTLEWTIWSVTGGPGLDAATGPPFADPDRPGPSSPEPASASGPVLEVAGDAGERTTLRTRLVAADPAESGPVECLCTPLRTWTSLLRRPDKPATVVTTYPPLPAEARQVRVRFAGLGVIPVPVTSAVDAGRRTDNERAWSPRTWRAVDLATGHGWTTDDWPTPVPAHDELPETDPTVVNLLR